jgi:hypothetical protein
MSAQRTGLSSGHHLDGVREASCFSCATFSFSHPPTSGQVYMFSTLWQRFVHAFKNLGNHEKCGDLDPEKQPFTVVFPGQGLHHSRRSLCKRGDDGMLALDQACAGTAARFWQIFHDLVHEPVQAEATVPAELLSRFEAIILEDSTSIRLPPQLKEQWPGCGGGQGQSEAGLKVHVRFDLKKGGMQGIQVSPGRQGDQSSALRQEGIKAGVLNITDESSCSLNWLKHQEGRAHGPPSVSWMQ